GWWIVTGLVAITSRIRTRGPAVVACVAFLALFGLRANARLWANEPPYFDQVRRQYRPLLAEHGRPGRTLISLGPWEPIDYYACEGRFGQYFDQFRESRVLIENLGKSCVFSWNNSDATPALAKSPEVRAAIANGWLAAPEGLEIPEALKSLECVT